MFPNSEWDDENSDPQMVSYPLVNIQKATDNHHIFNRSINEL